MQRLGGLLIDQAPPTPFFTRPGPRRPLLPPAAGHREADDRNRYSLPPHLSMKNLEMLTRAAATTEGVEAEGSKFGRHFSDLFDQRLDWGAIAWLKSISPLPLLIKARRHAAAAADAAGMPAAAAACSRPLSSSAASAQRSTAHQPRLWLVAS